MDIRPCILAGAALFFLASLGMPIAAQTGIAISPTSVDQSQAVEVTSDNLDVQQANNSALFTGNAKIIQGPVQLTADQILVKYNSEQSAIDSVQANGNVFFTNGVEVAEAQSGVYGIASGMVVLTGKVVLLQGPNAISGDKLTLDLQTSKGSMAGNVKSIFVPKSKQ